MVGIYTLPPSRMSLVSSTRMGSMETQNARSHYCLQQQQLIDVAAGVTERLDAAQ